MGPVDQGYLPQEVPGFAERLRRGLAWSVRGEPEVRASSDEGDRHDVEGIARDNVGGDEVGVIGRGRTPALANVN